MPNPATTIAVAQYEIPIAVRPVTGKGRTGLSSMGTGHCVVGIESVTGVDGCVVEGDDLDGTVVDVSVVGVAVVAVSAVETSGARGAVVGATSVADA